MKQHNSIKFTLVLLVFGNLLFSQNNFYYKKLWWFETIGSFSVYTMEGKHSFEDFVKTDNCLTNDTIQQFSISQNGIFQYVFLPDGPNSDTGTTISKFSGYNHNFQNKDSILTFVSLVSADISPCLEMKLRTNKMIVRFNLITKFLQILYYLESETLCVTKLEEYNVGGIDFHTSKHKTFYTIAPDWMLVPKK
jgi:hypothetical protein